MAVVYPQSSIYDDITDVMFFQLGELKTTSEEEVLPGIHVLYEYDKDVVDNVVAVEIEYFNERFSNSESIDIPAKTPFVLSFAK